ncbi:MAG TPA: hypothetical protein VJX67_17850 [Blastocatellia bacterium]|nr:hypothetical protein [Blastocatellia bacterium]
MATPILTHTTLHSEPRPRSNPLPAALIYERLIAAGSSPGSVIAYRPSEATRERVEDLIHIEKTSGLSEDEKAELDHYFELEHIMRLAKARAHLHVSEE